MKFKIRFTSSVLFTLFSASAIAQFPCLIYHAHENLGYDEDLFRSHMDFLHDNGYTTITPDQFLAWRVNDEPLPPRPVLLTVDDNYILLYTSMYPILKERGQVFVNFAIADSVGVDSGLDHCDWSELAEMEATGNVLTESHSRTHPYLTTLNYADEWSQIKDSRTTFEENMPDGTCRYFAYPYGDYDDDTINKCIMAGYAAAFSTIQDLNYRDTPLFEIRRLSGDGRSINTIKQHLGFNTLPPAPPGEGWTIDNDTSHFTHEPSAWITSSFPQAYGPTAAVRGPAGGAHEVRWALALPQGGHYRVHARWVSGADRATDATYRIEYGDKESHVTVDQTQNGGQWTLLGTYYYPEGSAAKVYLSDAANGIVSADAIWIEPTDGASGNTFVVY